MGLILCYGDSNTWGFDSRSYFGERYPETVRWTGLLRLAGAPVRNCGMNGREIPHTPFTTGEVERLCTAACAEDAPVWLWVMLGTNDLLACATASAEDVTARMEKFLSALLAAPVFASGAARLRLISPPPMQPGSWTDDRAVSQSLRLGALYGQLAARLGIDFTDGSAADVPLLYDGVHFSEQGHRSFAALMQSAL